MFSLIWKQTLARRGRLALTVVAVTLGVAFVVGALVLTDTSQKVFDDQFATATSSVDLTVRDSAEFDSAMGVEVDRDPLPSRVVDDITAVPGVATAVGVVKGTGLLIHDGRAIVPKGPSMLSSWVPDGLNGFALRHGAAPSSPIDVAIDVATARTEGIALGDQVRVQSNTSQRLTVTGLVGFGDNDGLPNTTVALVSLATAQDLVEIGPKYSEILVLADPSDSAGAVATSRLAEDVADAVGAGYDVSAARDTAAASAAAAKNQLGYLRITLFVLAGAALLIGGFLIANTFSIVVTQRTRELALLRAAGATGRQVFWSVVGEAALVGLLGGISGAFAGIGAAAGLRDLAGSIGIPLPDTALVVEARTLVLGAAIGVVITVLAALVPARRAAATSPVEAMRAGDTIRQGSWGKRPVIGLQAAVLAVGAAGLGLPDDGPVILVVAAAVLILVALVLLGPVLAPRLARIVGAPLRRLGVPGRMAAQSAARAPRRTAATVTALALSLGLIVFMGALASSIKATVSSTYTEVISADFVIESARGEMLGGLSHQVHHAVMDLPEVDVVARMQYGHWKEGTGIRALTAIEPDTIGKVTSLDMVDGTLTALADGGIVLSDGVAADRDLRVGDRFTMTFAKDGTRSLEIVGLVATEDAQALSTDYFISTETYDKLFAEKMDATLFIAGADGTPVREVEKALTTALTKFPTAEIRDQQEAVDGRMATVDQILGLVTVLLMFTVLIAFLGITNTLALSIVERTREIGLFRAVGMTRRQLGAMIRGEAVLVAAMALVIAISLGVALGAGAVQVVGRNADVTLELPYTQLLIALIAATVTGLLAGLLPARRAARTDLLTAIATD
jgi:putative ABC transport system permease protein